MTLRQQRLDDILILATGQKLSASDGGDELLAAVKQGLEAGTGRFLLDLSETEFIDSLGVGQIAASYKSIKDKGGRLLLCGLQPRVALVLRMASLHLVLDIKDTGPGDAIWG